MVDLAKNFQRSVIKIIKLTDGLNGTIVKAFPNPTRSQLNVSIPTSWVNKPVCYSLYTLEGDLIQRAVKHSANPSEIISLAQQKPGLYFLKVSSGSETVMQQILKTN